MDDLQSFKQCETCDVVMHGILKVSGDKAPRRMCEDCVKEFEAHFSRSDEGDLLDDIEY